mmetsp:Transcript_46553/g.75990  ORF Transcript_46553/g.75990 Transcript_46553/m.75990 type:complete len:142 (+) Transcript_46553:901-1326(+)
MYHNFTETELTVASPSLRVFEVAQRDDANHLNYCLQLQTLYMRCPKLEELIISKCAEYYALEGYDPEDDYYYEDRVSDTEVSEEDFRAGRAGLQCIDLSACANLRHINLCRDYIHSLSLEWILDLVSNGRNQTLMADHSPH